MTIAYLQKQFPKTRTNSALTGVIPLEYFEAHERLIRAIIKEYDLRLYYRGKRIGSAQNTRRKDAYGIVLYDRPKVKEIVVYNDNTIPYAKYALAAIFGLLFGYLLGQLPNAIDVANDCIKQSHNTAVDAIIYECLLHNQGE